MKNRISYENLMEIKSKCSYIKEIVQLNHAYRINGVIDIYKNINKNDQYVFLDIKNTIYHRFLLKSEAISFIKKFVSEHDQINTFDTRQNGKITYKSFIRNRELADWRPENYNFDTFKDEKYDDHLYFISDENYRIKIGRSINPEKRLKELQTGCPTNLKIEFVIYNKGCLEKKFHNCFKEIQLTGEWFTYSARFDDFFKYVKKYYSKNKSNS